jgi:hypothetical protein
MAAGAKGTGDKVRTASIGEADKDISHISPNACPFTRAAGEVRFDGNQMIVDLGPYTATRL